MWKKGDADQRPDPQPRPATQPASTPATPTTQRRSGERASIGPSIIIKGDVSGEEDLVIQGRIEGTVDLGTCSVTIGPEGRVAADVSGHTVRVEGEVRGNLRGQEQIVLSATARVEGNITAPRVTVDDGASFRGAIDMGRDPIGSGSAEKAKAAAKPPAPTPSAAADERASSQSKAAGAGPGASSGVSNSPGGQAGR
jgi:cytoskeletal protein CcmA (bactofilin family)